MIRLPPASISLSEKDISHHLQEIDVYHSLLKQGFKKKHISEFLKKQREKTLERTHPGLLEKPCRVLTWVKIASRQKDIRSKRSNNTNKSSSEDFDEGREDADSMQPLMNKKLVSNTGGCARRLVSQSRLENSTSSDEHPSILSSSLTLDVQVRAPVSVTRRAISNESAANSHAPRQSSLLRFQRTMSSDEHDEQHSDLESPLSSGSVPELGLEADTHANEESDGGSCRSFSSLANVFQQLLLDDNLVLHRTPSTERSRLRGDAKEFTPSNSPAQYSDAARELNSMLGRYGEQCEDYNWYKSSPANPRIVPRLQKKSSKASESIQLERPDSPTTTLLDVSLTRAPPLPPSSPVLPYMPSTPMLVRRWYSVRGVRSVRTEPRYRRHRYMDGNSFVPYDDSLPAAVQPQTPADLPRQLQVNELIAAFTVPPGRPREGHLALVDTTAYSPEPGEQSPTHRAVSIRQRRNREFARSARVEGLRISRTRRRFQANEDDRAGVFREGGDTWFDGGHDQIWRDDLDADRVGEENFEDVEQPLDTTPAAMRIVSGNRRAHGI